MIKIIAIVYILAIAIYVTSYVFYQSPNKAKIMKRAGIAMLCVSIAVAVLTTLTILF